MGGHASQVNMDGKVSSDIYSYGPLLYQSIHDGYIRSSNQDAILALSKPLRVSLNILQEHLMELNQQMSEIPNQEIPTRSILHRI